MCSVRDGRGGPGEIVLSYADLESSLRIASVWASARAILNKHQAYKIGKLKMIEEDAL